MQKSVTVTYRPAWASYWKSWMAIAGILTLSLMTSRLRDQTLELPSDVQTVLPLFTLIPIGLILGRVLFHRYSRTYQIEQNRRIRNTTGIVSRVRREFLISDKIQTDLKQTILGRLLNYGTLRFWTGDEQSGFTWTNVHDPARRETEVKQLAASEPPASEGEEKKMSRRAKAASSRMDEEAPFIDSAPPQGTQFADYVVLLPPIPGIIHTAASTPRFISKRSDLHRDHRFVERGDPLISISVPVRDLLLSSQKFEEVTIPSPVTGLVIRTGYDLPREMFDYKFKNEKSVDLSYLNLTTIIPVKNASGPSDGTVLFENLRQALWTHREYLFRRQMRVRHPSRQRWFNDFKTDEGVRDLLDELSNQDCMQADAMLHYHEFINEIWFKRPDLRIFLNPLVDEVGLRRFHEKWKTVPWDHKVEASLEVLRDKQAANGSNS